MCLRTSQTKPGPNMAEAVARKVERREEREENEVSMCSMRGWVGEVGFGDWFGKRKS